MDSMILFGFDFRDYDIERSGSAIVDTFPYCIVQVDAFTVLQRSLAFSLLVTLFVSR